MLLNNKNSYSIYSKTRIHCNKRRVKRDKVLQKVVQQK